MTMTSEDHRSRRLEAVDIHDEGRGKYSVTFEDGSKHDLIVDSYQRPLNQRMVDQIRDEWDPIAADALTLSLRSNGKVAIVDGQHCLVAALRQGETSLLAEIYENCTFAREANLRRKKNNSRADTALEKFYARLAEERDAPGKAKRIVKLLKEFDTQVNKSPGKYSGVNCISTIERVYDREPGGGQLRQTLQIISDAFGRGIGGETASSALIEGVSLFVDVHRDDGFSQTKLTTQMGRLSPSEIRDISRGFKRAMGGGDPVNVYRALVEVYNRATRSSVNKLEVKTARWTEKTRSGR